MEGKKVRSLLIVFCCTGVLVASGCGSGGNAGGAEDGNDPDQDTPPMPIIAVQPPVVTQAPIITPMPVSPEPTPTPVGELIPSEQQVIIETAESRPYIADGPYASVLKECALPDDTICTLGMLPYIGQSNANPTIEDIMQRLVVTHDWMGVRFEQMLGRLPADLLRLFGPVTSVVIGSKLRPSSFWADIGRMKIDPNYLWLSVAEKQTISADPDFRSNFGASLQFVGLRDYMLGDEYAVPNSSLTDENTRSIEDLDISLAKLLFHELAHANDYVQAENVPSLSLDITPSDALNQLEDTSVWKLLYDDASLTSQSSPLYGLARVRYKDDEPSSFQSSVLADSVGATMGNEGKAIFYGYVTQREDVATLFTSAMMKLHYNVETRVGFANKPTGEEGTSCDNYKVAWGVRNRIASSLVAPRAKFVVDKLLPPSAARDDFFNSGLGQAIPLRVGEGWCSSRFLNAQDAVAAKGQPEGLEWTMTPEHH